MLALPPIPSVPEMGDHEPGPSVAGRKLHPFFTTKPATVEEASHAAGTPESIASDDDQLQPDAKHAVTDADMATAEPRRKRRRTQTESAGEDSSDTNKAAKSARGRKPRRPIMLGGSIATHFVRLDEPSPKSELNGVEPDDARKDSGLVHPATVLNIQDTSLQQPLVQANKSVLGAESAIIANEAHHDGLEGSAEILAPATIPKPTKVLKFDPKTGTIGSPPKPTIAVEPETRQPKAKSRRRSKGLIHIRYGDSFEKRLKIGKRINEILRSPPNPASATPLPEGEFSTTAEETATRPMPNADMKTRATSSKLETVAEPALAKETHPFFMGKAKAPVNSTKTPISPSPEKHHNFTATPCSPKQSKKAATTGQFTQFGVLNRGLKFPGIAHPAWPWKGMCHVRGNDEDTATVSSAHLAFLSGVGLASRKSKGQAVIITEREDVMHTFEKGLHIQDILRALRAINGDEFLPPPKQLRVPQRRLESGISLQQRVGPRLSTSQHERHAGIARLYDSLGSRLSAYDQAQCESTAWTQKYSPAAADEILQAGKEATMLREWLEKLKVQAVDTGAGEEPTKVGRGRPSLKKTRKRKKLDGFVVSRDEESDEMDEVSDGDADWTPSGSQGATKKTIVRSGSLRNSGRVVNTVILSGPHGCGKTATVYAIAKELDFEVFEINASSRRGGKDVMERVGDMTRNHLVKHHKDDGPQDETGDGIKNLSEDELTMDIKSGKQSTLAAFMKPKQVQSKPKKKPGRKAANAPSPSTRDATTFQKKAPSKVQKQSLILLEEADLLFEEDKQFWATVTTLMAQSKRPFIITCNDESLIPMQSLLLHGIFRFTPPPDDLAADRLLLIAAHEGHILSRDAVASLYASRGYDLRAAITELNYWCQLGVGDQKGGLEWLYVRWPRGSDIDEHGDVVRVVSDGTYMHGLGWLGGARDHMFSECDTDSARGADELLEMSSSCWGYGLEQAWDEQDFQSFLRDGPKDNGHASSIHDLDAFVRCADMLSAVDCFSSPSRGDAYAHGFPRPDATLPPLPQKMSEQDFTIGLQLLDVPEQGPTFDPRLCPPNLRVHHLASNSTSPSRIHPSDSTLVASIMRNLSTAHRSSPRLTRRDFSRAFDSVAATETEGGGPAYLDSASGTSPSYLGASVFDRPTSVVVLEAAPYVRGIVSGDERLRRERLSRSGALDPGSGNRLRRSTGGLGGLAATGGLDAAPAAAGTGAKRMRTTRSALSALDGGSRRETRRERWFAPWRGVDEELVRRTAGKGWEQAADEAMMGLNGA